MTTSDVVGLLASSRLDPDEDEKADIRWAIGMEAAHAFVGARKPYPPHWWLQRLPWRPEYVSAEEQARMEASRARVMAQFAESYRRRKAIAHG